MQSKETSPDAYIASLPDDRRPAMERLRQILLTHLPTGFAEGMSYGMLGYAVPHSLYPAGYHCDPKQPLPFIGLASQKGHISLYHMGLYDQGPLLAWFVDEYAKVSKRKLDMGKACIRFKKPDEIPFDLIATLVSKMTPDQWIAVYEANLKR